MKKRILSILLTLCMVLCLVPTAAMAVDDTAIPKDEDGTYLIYTVEQLKIFRDRVNIDETGAINVKLMADIDLNGSEDNQWTPIGNGGLPSAYCGTFDGNGHTIKGLYINSDNEDRVGLFGYTVYPTVIHNLTVDGYVKGKDAVSSIVGYAYNTSISNCYNTGTISGNNYVGGIVGYAYNTNISSCYNIGTVNGNNYVGGIAGATSYANISNCYYLTGTAENGGGGEAKSEEEFADGTVLNLLKNGDTNSPWEKCGYLNAAGMIVPLLNGQTSDTFPIYTAEDLKQFRDMVYGGNTGICAKLMNDIVLNDGTFDENGNWSESGTPDRWTPIGDSNHTYAGTFDGGGHTIRGLYVKGASYAGLFGNIYQGTVKNVTVTGYVEGVYHVGGIVGYGIAATVTGCTNAATVKGGYSHVGGIVGRLYYEGNVRNCANLGSVRAQIDSERENACVGGIAGLVGFSATIADCYNAGSIAIQDSGTGKYTGSYLGGIIGKVTVLDLCYISNCYSVGSLTYRGSASAEIYGIAGDATACAISNCYWLEGTAESGAGGSPYPTTDITAHTKAEFADGTVLALLKGDRTDSPWADECQYLAAAGMTLPVFKGQGDSHEHSEKTGNCLDGIYCECGYLMHRATSGHNWGAWTSNGNDTHSHRCQNADCTASETDNCSGGEATCMALAACEICGQPYGSKNPSHHTGKASWITTGTTHTKVYSCCQTVIEAETAHIWENGKCTVCQHDCEHQGGTATCSQLAQCEICESLYGNYDPNNHKAAEAWTQENGKHYHICEYGCDTHLDETDCSGGTATCTALTVCETCLQTYGLLNPNNHTGTTEWIQTDTKHTQKYKCCEAIVVAEENHEWENGVCTKCGYGCRHTYEWQSENGQYWQKCKFCHQETAKKDIPTINISGADKVCRTQDYKFSFTLPEGSTDAAYGYEFIGLGDGPLTPTVEDNLYSGILKATIYPAEETGFKLIVSAKTADGFGFSAEKTVTIQNAHSGGEATCKNKAICEICGESYGELDSNNHADMKHIEAKAATKTAEGNIEYWHCEGCGKYFADKGGAKEITKADTVTAKLPEEKPTSPATGDTSNFALWIALLFISGGVVTATTVYGRKKKRSAR